MTTVVKRYPTFEIDLITEKTGYQLTYDTSKQLTQKSFEESLISFSVKNSMSDDSPVFSLVITAKQKWDKLLNPNNLIRIRTIPDVTKGRPDNPYVMVGLLSDIRKEGEYADGTLLYRITGRAMTKALIDFNVGVIQEVATIIPSLGWLPDGGSKGLQFSGNTAAGIGNELMERFVYKHAKYKFSNGKTLKDYLVHAFTSWEKDESLADVTPFINYEGSIRQFLEDISAKPFNELFFEYTSDGQCIALMRPTPFDPDKWYQLPAYRFTSDIVVEESFGKTDAEMYSVFVVQAPNVVDFNSMDLGVYPKFHKELIEKYGYKRLDAENRYLLSSTVANATQDATAGGDTSVPLPSYEEVLTFITQNNYQDPEILRTQKDTVYSDLIAQFPAMSETLANNIIDSLKAGDFTQEEYNNLKTSTGDKEKDKEINKEKSVASKKLDKYTQRLFNWYCENANFYSGDLRVLGNPAYRLGSRVFYEDFEQETTWEFYIESVQHEFSFTSGYTTILGVTRGLPESGANRFTNLWGKSEDFKGGYFGEMSLQDLLKEAKKAQNTTNEDDGGGDWGDGSGGGGAMGALNTAKAMAERKSVYVFGGGRTGKNPFLSSPIKIDCSSFVWWCYYLNGVTLNGGKTGMTTDTIKVDKQLKTISSRGSSKSVAKSKMQQGDIIYFDTYKGDGHVGIYLGAGKFIGAQSSTGIAAANMNSGYWWNKFNGRVLRYEG
ncbi:putative tail lysin [Bacillus phage BSP38]|uniref:Putative tail lysin n=1 Tax=Bacillus phage BSP38 TaxID=2283013 RepID=A0A345MJU7_BPBSP|nr:tail protein with lysin activity [Bacillus phage BSP38]AXH71129.1 putative tail lysin [Bacillus phage BSP38]